jgi:hypothetical protein
VAEEEHIPAVAQGQAEAAEAEDIAPFKEAEPHLSRPEAEVEVEPRVIRETAEVEAPEEHYPALMVRMVPLVTRGKGPLLRWRLPEVRVLTERTVLSVRPTTEALEETAQEAEPEARTEARLEAPRRPEAEAVAEDITAEAVARQARELPVGPEVAEADRPPLRGRIPHTRRVRVKRRETALIQITLHIVRGKPRAATGEAWPQAVQSAPTVASSLCIMSRPRALRLPQRKAPIRYKSALP